MMDFVAELRPVGIYAESYARPRPDPPSVRQQPLGIADRARVVDYMRAVTPAFDVLDVTVDLVDGTTKIRSGSSLVTDGVWVWRTDSIRHLAAHGLPIDPDFLEHVRARDYRTPKDVEVTDELEDALLRYY
ncbi:hypothetical protein [Saccharothrix coeruleofusca]|uniref:Uncharacterized protein n=1 Tax=Saccharothrix coeruleofusca TaxID=33919 RepID=A0A918EFJ6_9PSEU|nr:hypothetical protein [Saccharothrix coeruleofusca]GGP74588.1 hypothetical protein GCM10010185_55260 [Saccharothrix coeruleofusca]